MRVAASVLVALALLTVSGQGASPLAQEALHFVADLKGEHVAPAAVRTAAAGRASAVLAGHRLTVHGSFTALSSALRDLATTPDDPGVHLHRGAPGETTPYFHGFRVQLGDDERSGIFWGSVELTDEQRALLLAGRLYVDVHTEQHGPGEIRDQWRPSSPSEAARARALATEAPAVQSAECHPTGSDA